ncbi:U4/U6.U5 small nuclear ribonucleoprotein 27 kDa protein-like [Oncorhynchus tshawytscha]|uniref:U4/U6.U5 small nuclear ribonucleoprotein 27 kDa protein-like n=1 Tax=Oncorhynchus tshawytscha TaxID=74940 RepID=UPI000D0A775C|nr:U4/U6.U5 small nuclear ribonucleoprotein 27 kDa protein-like [Oncorhynchus tshawytscha]
MGRSRSRSPPKREEDMQGKTKEEIEMMKIMGFGNFDTTKGRKTDGAVNAHAINVSQKRKYRHADSLSLETTRGSTRTEKVDSTDLWTSLLEVG